MFVLDIEMPSGNRFNFLICLKCYKYKADGYLLKPIDLDDLEELIESLQLYGKWAPGDLTRIVFKTPESIEYLLPTEIIRIESDGNY